MTAALEIQGLSKAYGNFRALEGVSFQVEEDDILAILE